MKHNIFPLFLFLGLSSGILFSCSKSAHSTTASLAVTVINPTHGPAGDTVTITGSGFALSASMNSVSFNGKTAAVINASSTQLQVTVPSLCGTGKINVSTNGNTVQGPVFTYDTTFNLTTFATGLDNPQYLTIDDGGNLYVTNFGNGTISKISSAGVVSTFTSGLNGPTGITIDANSNIYVATNNNLNQSPILKITPSGAADTFATVTGYVYGLTIDNSGNLYAANSGAGAISKITSSGTVSTFASGMPGLTGIVVSSNGNFYATGSTNGAVYKVTATGAVTAIFTGFSFGAPNDIVVDNNNDLYITVYGNNTLTQYNTVTKMDASGAISTLTAGLDEPCGLIIDVNGNFYVVNSLSGNTLAGTVSKITVQ
jgi:sugar lactone lactonase YvrE